MVSSGETRAIARLPNLEIEVLHKPAAEGRGEQVAVLLSAGLSPSAPALLLGFAQPMLFWMQFMEAVWAPWMRLGPPVATSRASPDRP